MSYAWRRIQAAALAVGLIVTAGAANAASEIELFFPVPVDGKLARDMATLIKEFNDTHPDIKAVPVYTGSYDETLIKTRASIKAGKPPAAVIMSANFLTDLKIEGDIAPLDDLIKASGTTAEKFMSQFWPALHGNAVLDSKVYGVPFHNSTPLLYYNVDHFKEAGLDPDKPPQNWAELVTAAKKLTKREGDRVTRWGIMMPSNYDYGGWILTALTMSNGGKYYNEDYGGEIYYDTPSMLGAMTFWNDLRVQAQGPSGRRAEGAGRLDVVPVGAGLDDAALDRLADACARKRQVPLQGGVRADECAPRGCDRRRLAGDAGGARRSKTQGELDADRVAYRAGKVRLVEPCHRLLRAEHGRL